MAIRTTKGRSLCAAAAAALASVWAPAGARAAINAAGTTSVSPGGAAASFSINVTVAAGDFLVAHVAKPGGTQAPTGPAGWVRRSYLADAVSNFSLTTWTFSVSVSGTYAFTWNKDPGDVNGSWGGGITRYTGVDLSCPVGQVSTGSGTTVDAIGNRSTFTLPVITTGVAGAMLDAGYAAWSKNKQYTPAAGWTTRVNSRSNQNNSASTGSSGRVQAVLGGTGTVTVTLKSSAAAYLADILELTPGITTGVTLAPSAMTFATSQGTSPVAQTFTITNNHATPGCPSQTYTSAAGSFSAGWSAANLPAPVVSVVSLPNGATSAAVSVVPSTSALPSGTYTAVITVTDAGGNSEQIAVTLVIQCAINRETSVATATASVATSLTLTEPAGWNNGDVLVAVLAADTTTAPATPAGWTLVGSNTAGGNHGQWVYQSVKNGAATAAWTGFASGKLAGAMASYFGGWTVSPIGAPGVPFAQAPTASGPGNVDVNACTTSVDRQEVLAAYSLTAASAGTSLFAGPGLAPVTGDISTGAAAGDVDLKLGSDLVVAAAGTVLGGTGTVLPSQGASKLGSLLALTPAPAPPAVTVTKTPAAPSQGDRITYSILVTNPLGNAPVRSVTLSDTLPAGVSFVSLSADAAGAGLALSGNPGPGAVEGASGTLTTPLAPGAGILFTLVGDLGCAVSAEQSSSVFAATPGMCGAAVRIVDAFLPGLVLAPSVSTTREPALPTRGDTVTYQITVTNNNSGSPLNSLVFSDTLPAGLTVSTFFVDGAGAGLTLARNGQVVGASGVLTSPLGPGSGVTFTMAATVGCAASGAQANQAYAETASTCQKSAAAADSFTPGAVSAPSVTVFQSPASPAPGAAVAYLIVVRNTNATADLNEIIMSDTLPAGVTFVSLEGGSDGSGDGLVFTTNPGPGSVQGSSGLLSIPLPAGSVFTFTLTGTVDCAAAGVQTNTASAATAGRCTVSAAASSAFTVAGPGLAVTTVLTTPAGGATVTPGALVGYRMVVTNTGGATLTSLTVVDTLASQLVGVTTTATGFALPAVTGTASGSLYVWSGSGLTMEPGASYTFSVTGLAGPACAAVAVGNTAYATAGTACGQDAATGTAVAGVFTLAPPAAAVSVSAAVVGAPAAAGDPVTYRLVVANAGSATLEALDVSDTVPADVANAVTAQPGGFTVTVADVPGSGTRFVWSAAGLGMAPGATFTFTVAGFARAACAVTTVTNFAAAAATWSCGAAADGSGPAAFTVSPPSVALSVSVTRSPATAAIGDPVTYRIAVTNAGAATLSVLNLTDTVAGGVLGGFTSTEPAGFAPAAVTDLGGTGGTRFAWSGSGLALAPGTTFTFTITGAAGMVCAPASLSNTAAADASSACGTAAFAAATVTPGAVVPPPATAVSVSLASTPAAPRPGEPVTYTILVTNAGSATLASLSVADTLPSAVAFTGQANSGGLVWNGATSGVLAWTGPVSLAPAATVTVTVDGVAAPCFSGTVDNRAWTAAASACAAAQAASALDTFSLAALTPAVAVSKTHAPASPPPGTAVTYTLIATNTSASATLTSLIVVDTLSPNVAFTGQSNSGGLAWNGATSGVLAWGGTVTLAPLASVTVTVDGTTAACFTGSVDDEAFVTGSNACGAAAAASAVDSFALTALTPSVAVTVAHAPAAPRPGEAVSYTLIVTNTSASATLASLTVADTLPAAFVFGSQSNSAGLVWNGATSGVAAWTGAVTLAPGASVTVTLDGTAACVSGSVNHRGWAKGSNACGTAQGASALDGFTLTVLPPTLAVTLTHAPAQVLPGGAVSYMVLVTNASAGATLTSLTVTDTLPAEVAFASQTNSAGLAFSQAGALLTWSGAVALAPGATVTVTIDGAASACFNGTVTNTAWAKAIEACGAAEAAATDAFMLTSVSVAVATTHQPALPGNGNPVTYTLIVTNTSPSATLSSLAVADTLPASVGFTSESSTGGLAFAQSGQLLSWTGALSLAPGMSVTMTVEGVNNCAAGSVVNAGWAAGSNGCVTGETVSPDDVFSPGGAVTLQMIQQRTPAAPRPGEPVAYAFWVTNTSGGAVADNLDVVDTLPAAVTLTGQGNSGGLTFAQNGQVLSWTGPLSLGPGETVTMTVDGVAASCVTGAVTNRGWAKTSDGCGSPQAASAADSFALAALTPALSVTKRHAPASPFPGAAVSYTLLVTNTSASATLTGLTVVDTLSSAVTFAGQSNSGGLTWNGATSGALAWSGALVLAPGATATVTIDATTAACFTGSADDQAWARGLNACGAAEAASAVDSFPLTALTPAVGVTLARAPAVPRPGEPVTYTIIVTNESASATLATLAVSDTLPAGMVFGGQTSSAGLAFTQAGAVLGWSGTVTLAPGASVTITVDGTAASCFTGNADNRGWARGTNVCDDAEAASAVDSFALTALAPALAVAKRHEPAAPVPGGPVSYTLIVTNTSASATLTSLTIVDTLQGLVTYSGAESNSAGLAHAVFGAVHAWNGAVTLAPLASVTVSFGAVNACGAGSVDDRAWAKGANACGIAEAASAVDSYVLAPQPIGLAVTATRTPAAPVNGGPVSYVLIVTNTGASATLAALTVTDTLPADIAFASASNSAGLALAQTGQVLAWTGTVTLAPGGSVTVTVDGTAGACVTGTVTNRAWARGAEACGAAEAASAPDAFDLAAPVLAVSVAAARSPATPGIGEAVIYRIDVTNTGGATITSLSVTDTLSPVIVAATSDQASVFGGPAVVDAGTGTRYVWSATGLAFLPGQTYTFTLTGSVGPVCGVTEVVSGAQVTAAEACGVLAQTSPEASFSVAPPVAGLAVASGHLPAAPVAGQSVTYRLVVTNAGADTLTALAVSDTLPAQVAFGGEDHPAGFAFGTSGTTVGWEGAGLFLTPGMSLTFTVTGTTICAGGSPVNVAFARGLASCGAAEAVSAADALTIFVPAPALSVATERTPATPGIGEAVTFRIDVTNAGAATLSSLAVTDTLAAVVVSATTDGPAAFGGPLVSQETTGTLYVWSATGLVFRPGDTLSFTITGRVGAVCMGTAVTNGASAAGANACGGAAETEAETSYTVDPAAQALAVAMSHSPAAPEAAGTVTYTLVVTNTGAATLLNLSVAATLPAQVAPDGTHTDDGLAFSTAGPVVVWSGAVTLLPGQSRTVSAGGVLGCAGGAVSVTAWAGGVDACGGAETSASSAFVLAAPVVAVAATLWSSPASPEPGGPVTYTLLVTNTGTATLTSLAVSDTLPAAVTLGSQANTGGLAWNGATSGVLAWSGTVTLAPGATVTVTIDGSLATAGGPVTNAASAAGANACGSASAAAGPVSFTLASPATPPVIGVTRLAAAKAAVDFAETLVVTMTVANTGGTAASAVTPTVLTPGGDGAVVLLSGPSPASVGRLEPGATATFTWVFRPLRGGNVTFSGGATAGNAAAAAARTSTAVTIAEAGRTVADAQVYPTPFNPALGGTLKFRRLPALSAVRLYSVAGESVRELLADGNGFAVWDGRNGDGTVVAGGVYYYVIQPPQGGRVVGKLEVMP